MTRRAGLRRFVVRWAGRLALAAVAAGWSFAAQAQSAPPKPIGFSVSLVETRATLQAQVPADTTVTRWEYRQKTGSNGNWGSWKKVVSNSWLLVATISNLDRGKTYGFQVRAVNNAGEGPESDSEEVSVPATAPPKPSSFTATAGDRQVTLSASVDTDNGSEITRWQYQRKTGSDGSYGDWKDIASSNAKTSISTVVTGLTNGTAYGFNIRAENGAGRGGESESGMVTPSTTPAKPTGLTATAGNGAVTLTWTAGGNGGTAITGWKYIKHSNNAWDSDWTEAPNSGADTTSYTVPNLTNGAAYKFKVRAVNANGDGAESDESGEVTPSASAPVTLTASGVTATTAKLAIANWSKAWSFKGNRINCTNVAAGTSEVDLSGLRLGWDYLVDAYGAHNCPLTGNPSPELDSVIFTTLLRKVEGVSVTAGAGSLSVGWTAQSYSPGSTGYHVQWKSETQDWSSGRQSDASTNSATISSLTEGATYSVRVRSYHRGYMNRVKYGEWSDTATATAAAPTLAASSVTHDSATLTIGNHGGDWHYKANAAPHASCSSTAVTTNSTTLSGLSGNTSYAYKAYSDSGCNAELAAASAFLTKPGKPAKPTATAGAGSGKLTLASSVTGGGTISNWQYTKDNGVNWTDIDVTSTTLSYVVENLTDGTNYAFKVRAVNATGTGPDSDASDAAAPANETLTVSNVTKNGATLTIGNHPGNWHYKHASGTCSSEQTGTAASVTGLAANTSYTFTAYSDRCTTAVAAAAAFPTLPPKPAKPTATAGAGSGKLTLASSVTGDADLTGWEYKKKPENGSFDPDWTSVTTTSRTLSQVVSDLTNGTNYVFKVRAVNASGDGAESDESDAAAPLSSSQSNTPVTPPDVTLTAGSVTHDSATLTIGGHSGDWHYKANAAPHASCSSNAVTTSTVDLTNLSGNTNYTYKAYSDSGCTNGNLLATASAFLTKPDKPAKPTATAGAGSGKLTLSSSVTGGGAITGWQYTKDNGTNWSDIDVTSTTLSYVVENLTDGTNYAFKVRAVNATGTGPDSDASDAAAPASETLTVSNVTKNGATLTIGNYNYAGGWYYKHASGNCSAEQTVAAASVTGLSANTSYTFTAYSDSCSTTVATAPAFPTLPPKPAKPAAAPGAGGGKLTLTSSVTGGADLIRWEYKKKPENGSFDPDWTSVAITSGTLSHVVSSLDNNKSYRFKVRAVNASGDGAESDESDAAAPAAPAVTPPTAKAPLAPSTPIAAAGDASVALSWTPGGDGGSAVTKWQYRQRAGNGNYGAWTDVPGSGASTRRHTVAGLSNGTAYRFKVRAVNAIGTGTASPESAAVTPVAPAALPMGWLARFGRAAGSQAVEMLTGRMNGPAQGGSRMTIGGQSVDLNEDPERFLTKEGAGLGFPSPTYEGTGSLGLARWRTAGGPGGDESIGAYRETTVSELLRGGSFHLASAKESEAVPGGRWSMWGRGARTSFEGGEAAAQGDVTTAMLGMDYEKGGVLMGVAISHSRGEGGFGNAGMEAALTSAHPYLRFALNERISAWGILGVGRGEMTLEEKGRKIETDMETRMGAFGVRGELMRVGGFDLAVKSDALMAQTDADVADGLAAVSAEATRLRVMLEASREVAMEGGGAFTPSVEAGLRHDGGDADDGVGVEVGGGLRFTNPAWGLTLELKARGLITHEEEDVSDWGAGGTLRIAPGEAGRGLALTVRPSVGETAGGIARLWSVEDASRLTREEAGDLDPRVRAEVGYGLDAWGGLLTPYAGLSASESGGAYRLGGRFRMGESLSMSLEGGVREREDDGPVHGVALRGSLRW